MRAVCEAGLGGERSGASAGAAERMNDRAGGGGRIQRAISREAGEYRSGAGSGARRLRGGGEQSRATSEKSGGQPQCDGRDAVDCLGITGFVRRRARRQRGAAGFPAVDEGGGRGGGRKQKRGAVISRRPSHGPRGGRVRRRGQRVARITPGRGAVTIARANGGNARRRAPNARGAGGRGAARARAKLQRPSTCSRAGGGRAARWRR